LLRDIYDGVHVASGFVGLGRIVPAVELLPIEEYLESTAADRSKGYGHFPIVSRDDLGRHTGSLPEVASGDAVLDLEMRASFYRHGPLQML